MKRKDLHNQLQTLILISLALTAISTIPATATAVSSTPTYVLGVSDPLDPLVLKLQTLTTSVTLLPAASDLALVGASSILFIDGAWLASLSSLDPTILSLATGKVLEGVPTVVVRGNPAIIGDSVSGLTRLKAPDLPLLAEGLRITGTLADGTRQGETLQVASGFDYAVEREFTWAEQQISQPSTTTITAAPSKEVKSSKPASPSETSITQTTTDPEWEFIIKVTFSTGDNFAPHGRVTTTFTLYRLKNDGTDEFKWFNMFMELVIEPGISIYDSRFRTSDETDRVRVDPNTNLLVDHGPELFTTEGPDVVTYDIGVTNTIDSATVTATQTVSYPLKHTTVTDNSQDAAVSWTHDVDSRTDAGRLTFTIIPGWTVRVQENRQIFVLGDFTSTFDQLMGNTVAETASRTLSLTVAGG